MKGGIVLAAVGSMGVLGAMHTLYADEAPRNLTPFLLKLTQPDGSRIFGKKASQQYCYTDFEINEKGDWTASTTFSNGSKWDGDNFQAILTVKDKRGNSCLAVSHVRGMSSANLCKGGGACERTVSSSGKIDMSSHDVSTDYGYVCTGWDSTDDLLVATGAIVKIGCTLVVGPWSCSTIYPVAPLAPTGKKAKKPLCGP